MIIELVFEIIPYDFLLRAGKNTIEQNRGMLPRAAVAQIKQL
jgi:hypothetical protein